MKEASLYLLHPKLLGLRPSELIPCERRSHNSLIHKAYGDHRDRFFLEPLIRVRPDCRKKLLLLAHVGKRPANRGRLFWRIEVVRVVETLHDALSGRRVFVAIDVVNIVHPSAIPNTIIISSQVFSSAWMFGIQPRRALNRTRNKFRLGS